LLSPLVRRVEEIALEEIICVEEIHGQGEGGFIVLGDEPEEDEPVVYIDLDESGNTINLSGGD